MTKPQDWLTTQLTGRAFNVLASRLESKPRWLASFALTRDDDKSTILLSAFCGAELARAVEEIPNGAKVVATARIRPRGRGVSRDGQLVAVELLEP
jgi:hypothetical protein